MPIYLVRWPEMRVSLIQAEDSDELVYLLDEAGDPGGCSWEVYDGPLWFDLKLPVDVRVRGGIGDKPVSEADIEVDTGELVSEPWWMDAAVGDSDTGSEMLGAIRSSVFPNLHAVLEATEGEDVDRRELETAVRRDLKPLLQYSWRHAQVQSQEGPEAELMREMGITTPANEIFDTGTREDDDEEE